MTRRARALLVAAIALYAVLPLYWIALSAVRPTAELLLVPPRWIPHDVSSTNLVDVWSVIPLAKYLANSAVVAAGTALLAVIVSALAAYGLVRFRPRGSSVVTLLVLFALTVPTVVLLVPFYELLTNLGLLERRTGLVLSYAVWAIPFNTLLLRGYFQHHYTAEIEEAALLDGCSRISVLWRMVLPLSLPGLVAAATFTMLLAWNEFIWASVVTTEDAVRTAPVGLQVLAGQYATGENFGLWMAGAVWLTVPVVAGFLAVQKHLVLAYGGAGR